MEIDVDETVIGGIKLHRSGRKILVEMPAIDSAESIEVFDRLEKILREGYDAGFSGVSFNVACKFER